MKFSKLAFVYDRISDAEGEPKKVKLLAKLLRQADVETLKAAAHFTLGEVADPQISDRLGIGPGTIRETLASISGTDTEEIDTAVKQTGDMSEVVAAAHFRRSDTLTVDDLWRRTNHAIEFDEDRLDLIEYVYRHTTPDGAKYFTRMVLNQMRIGVGMGALAKALARAFDVKSRNVEHLYAMSNDIGLAATRAREGQSSLEGAALTLFKPYQFMNAQKVDDPAEIFEKLAGKQIIFEVKYDGARLQIHIKKNRPAEIKLYSRRLNEDTASMPDVVAALRKAWKGGDAIIEGEAVAFDPALEKKQPFQSVLMRLGRKYDIEAKAAEIPLVIYLFDLLW